jgi:polar amino acid transport system substrate-binding protein
MIRKHLLAVLVTTILLLNGPHCMANDIKIFGNEYKPPKVYLENDKPNGILVDIMKYIEKETAHSFDILLYPWKRAYALAERGQGGIIGLSMTKERLEIFDYSDVMYYDDLMLVVIKGNEFPFNTLEDLKGKRVGVRRGSSYGDDFERGKKDIFIADEDSDAIQRLKKLLIKRIDVALIGPGKAGVNKIIKSDPELLKRKDDFVLLEKPFKRDPNYLGISKTLNMKGLIQDFNKTLKKGYEDGTIQAIIDKHSD